MKKLVLALIVVAMVVLVANAAPPPDHGYGGGWGTDPTTWADSSGSFYAWGLWDPSYLGVDRWRVFSYDPAQNPSGYGTQIVYANISLNLWLELVGIQTYQYTNYQWHFADLPVGGRDVDFIISGTIRCNENTQCSLTMQGGIPLGALNYVEGQFNNGTTIPLTWSGRWGDGIEWSIQPLTPPWTAITYSGGDLVLPYIFLPCDHWFQFKGHFNLAYHTQDGHYQLVMGGCPAPNM